MRIIIAGNHGHIGYVLHHLQSVSELEVIAVVGPERMLEPCRAAGHQPQHCPNLAEALALGPDAACLDGPFELHASWAMQALAAGCHVFVEKPIALTIDDLERLRGAWRASGKRLLAMHGIRYDDHFYTAHRLVAAGAIGQVRLLHGQKSYRLGQRPEHYRHRATYGGTLPWVGSHAVDWLRWFSGRPFTAVTASHSCIANHDHGELEATAAAQFQLTDGVAATINVDYLRHPQAGSHGDDRLRVVGDAGVIEVRHDQVWLDNDQHRADRPQPLLSAPDILADVIGAFRGQPALMSDDDAFAVTQACLLARDAADSGQSCPIPPLS